MTIFRKSLLGFLFIGFGIVVMATAGRRSHEAIGPVIQGWIEANQIDVASKVGGRIAEVAVREGDTVTKGQVIARLETPEVDSKMAQAEAIRAAAQAQNRKAQTGARAEEIAQAKTNMDRAVAAADLAKKTCSRIESLYSDGVLPEQRRDEALAQWRIAEDTAEAAKALHEMTLSGARPEDKDAAAAQADQANGLVDEVEAAAREATLEAPSNGEISQRYIDPGEIAPAGYPVAAIVDLTDQWVTLYLREDQLMGMTIGDPIQGTIPALGNLPLTFTVFHLAAQADFATWRSTGASGGYDLKSFEVRARPESIPRGLRPGMSVLIHPSES